MNKREYMARLGKALSKLPEAERQEILADYEEHFELGRHEGKSEEEIAASLGNPKVIGKSFQIEALLQEREEGYSLADILRAVFASLSLGFFNIIFVLGPFVGLVAVLIGLWATGLALALSGIAAILALILHPFLPFVQGAGQSTAFIVFASIGISALGLLSLIGLWPLSRWFFKLTVKYIRFNARVIKK